MPVFIGSTPNTTERDLKIAKEIISGKIDITNSLSHLKNIFQKKFHGKDMYFFNRGRDSMYFLFQNLNLQPDDEIIIQGFTCVAVAAPILWAKCKPIFVDIKRDSFNMDLDRLKEKITPRTRVIISQHTFGNIADMLQVRKIVDNENSRRNDSNDIFLLEDCAHILDFDNGEIGKYSDAFFFSFAQDKSISSTQGAVLILNNKQLLNENIDGNYENIPEMSKQEALYNARYILYWDKIKKTYFKKILLPRITLGKILWVIYHLLGKIKKQASSNTTDFDGIHKMSDVQASLLLTQLEQLSEFNSNRKKISNIYGKEKILLRYPMLVENTSEVIERLRENGVIVGKWYSSPVYPITWDNLECLGYKMAECPEAEFCAKHIINLPTNIEVNDDTASEILKIVNKYAKRI